MCQGCASTNHSLQLTSGPDSKDMSHPGMHKDMSHPGMLGTARLLSLSEDTA